jgi:hypothetical protein
MSSNLGAAKAADEENKTGGDIHVAAITNATDILCLYPNRNSDQAGETAFELMTQVRQNLYDKRKDSLAAVVWDSKSNERISFKKGREALCYFVLSKGENMYKPATCLELVMNDFEKLVENGNESTTSMKYQEGFESTLAKHAKDPKTKRDAAYENRMKEVIALALNALELQLERQTKIVYTENLSTTLVESSGRMKDSSAAVRKKYCWENAKCWIGIAVIVVIIIIILVVAICVSTGDCK